MKISAFPELTNPTGDEYAIVAIGGVNKRMSIRNLLSGPSPLNDPATMQGVDITTTARLAYGLNVIQSADSTNFSTRLPLVPIKGKSVIIVNNSGHRVQVYPSVSGGSLNGVVDGYINIPADKQAYTIYCWENPLPGSWSVQLRTSSLIQTPEWTIAHTNGVQDVRVGIATPVASAIGIGSSGGSMILTPDVSNWGSLNQVATAQTLRVDTNVVSADLAGSTLPDCIVAWRAQAYMTGSNSGTSGQRETLFFPKDLGSFFAEISEVPAGSLSTPPVIGDTGTRFGVINTDNVNNFGDQIGLGGAFSRYYYIFAVQIPASAATKTYRFKFQLDYL